MAYDKSEWLSQWESPYPSAMKTKAYKWYSQELYAMVLALVSEFNMRIDSNESSLSSDRMEIEFYTGEDDTEDSYGTGGLLFTVVVEAARRGIIGTYLRLSADLNLEWGADSSDDETKDDEMVSAIKTKFRDIEHDLKSSVEGVAWYDGSMFGVRTDPYSGQYDDGIRRVDLLVSGNKEFTNVSNTINSLNARHFAEEVYDFMREFALVYKRAEKSL